MENVFFNLEDINYAKEQFDLAYETDESTETKEECRKMWDKEIDLQLPRVATLDQLYKLLKLVNPSSEELVKKINKKIDIFNNVHENIAV